ncbi:MAG: glutathione binding-like protein [Alphaproteobacteria bacterium]|nr:glutathione binding-like protein [Alphaproteobacteria bacterium]
MIDLYYWTTPNGHKITMMLEEAGLDYKILPINISKGEQFDPDFLEIAPNNRIPAIVDHEPLGGTPALPLFESGAILQYLAAKSGKFAGQTEAEKWHVIQWLMWQMGGLGPMAGQNHHFVTYAPERIPYAMDRYINETARLYAVMNKQLGKHKFLAGDNYSIADMACYPWVVPYERQKQDIDDFPNLKRWFNEIKQRPATIKAYKIAEDINTQGAITDEESRKILFGQTAESIKS